jgi:hypothetical protein
VKPHLILLAAMLLGVLASFAQAEVDVRETTVSLPTYPPGPCDKNPIFYTGSVYQGAQGRVYLYPLQDVLRDENEDTKLERPETVDAYARFGGENTPNGHKVAIALKNTAAAQEFVFPNQLTAWVKLTDLRETFPLGDNGVTEWEVYGKDLGEQGASIAHTL